MSPEEKRFERASDRLLSAVYFRSNPAGSAALRELERVQESGDPAWVDQVVEAAAQRFVLRVLREPPSTSLMLLLAQFAVLVQAWRRGRESSGSA